MIDPGCRAAARVPPAWASTAAVWALTRLEALMDIPAPVAERFHSSQTSGLLQTALWVFSACHTFWVQLLRDVAAAELEELPAERLQALAEQAAEVGDGWGSVIVGAACLHGILACAAWFGCTNNARSG